MVVLLIGSFPKLLNKDFFCIFPYLALIFPSRLMMRLWHCVALILLFVGAIHGQSRTGYIFLVKIYITNVLQFISAKNFSF